MATNRGENIRDVFTFRTADDKLGLSEVREIAWDTVNYSEKMRGLLIMPLNYQPQKPYPLIVDIHGGGSGAEIFMRGGILMKTPLEWQFWAAKGYVVFIPEFRSSAAFGSLAIRRDDIEDCNIVECDIVDIESGNQHLIAEGIVDEKRMAIIGHSAGARRANWLTVSRHQFKAVVSKDGWADEMIVTTIFPSTRFQSMMGGSPLKAPHNYLKNSAFFHSRGATTPTLFLMGDPELGGIDPFDML